MCSPASTLLFLFLFLVFFGLFGVIGAMYDSMGGGGVVGWGFCADVDGSWIDCEDKVIGVGGFGDGIVNFFCGLRCQWLPIRCFLPTHWILIDVRLIASLSFVCDMSSVR